VGVATSNVYTYILAMLTGVEEAGNALVNKQFFDTLTIIPHVDSDVIASRARKREINLRYFPNGMVSYYF